MASSRSPQLYTVDQYLAIERQSEDRYEYLDGEIYAMASEGAAHADISANLGGLLHLQLRGAPCRVRVKDTKVRSGPRPSQGGTSGLFSYPDLIVICGEPEYHDEYQDVILNPTAIIEVLSASTESFDRGTKFLRYQVWNSSLVDYVLVSQTYPRIEHYSRQRDSGWSYYVQSGLRAEFQISKISCHLRLADVYERVVFRTDDTEKPEI